MGSGFTCQFIHTSKEERTVLIWTDELRQLGFRQKSDRYWHCAGGYGLDDQSHLSVFLWTCHARLSQQVACFQICEFHVTFERAGHNLHFYYHELRDNEWTAGGHTSTREITTLGLETGILLTAADEIANQFVGAINGILLSNRARGQKNELG